MVSISIKEGRQIGGGAPCFIIAEAGVNHNGDLDLARQLVEAAAKAGADAVKFQTFKAAKLATAAAPKAAYQKVTDGAAESQQAMLRRLELPESHHVELIQHCRKLGILFMSSPFDEDSADFLLSLGVSVLKVPSGEITNLPYLRHIGRLGLPVILSTGMSYLGEVEEAVRTLSQNGNPPLALLHCVSNYPAPAASCNLRAMGTLAGAFGVPVGFSDHTVGNDIAIAAVALGAAVIEKHFTIDRSLPGPDHQASIEPEELRRLVSGIRAVESALGDGRKVPVETEADTAAVARKSVVAALDVRAGTRLEASMISMCRPGGGIPSRDIPNLLGRVARVDIAAGTTLSWSQFT